MNRFILEYLIDDIKDDNEFELIINNIEEYLTKEKQYLEENDIKIINFNVENSQIEIDLESKNKIKENLFKKIPFKIYNFDEILTSKRIDNNCKNLDLRTNIILSYFKEKNIHYGTNKDNKIIFSCFYPGCNKTNLKCFIFKNSFHSMSLSETDCCNEEHYKFYKEVQEELQYRYRQSINLDQEYIKWDIRYVIVKYKDNNGNIIQCNLKKYFNTFKNIDNKPKFESKIIICIENVKKLLNHYGIEIKFNIITKEFSIYQFNKLSRYNLDYWTTEINNKFDIRLLRITREKLSKILVKIGFEKECNPFIEYLQNVYNTFNNIDDSEFKKLLNCINCDNDNSYEKIKKFMLQSVNLGCRNEYNNDSLRAAFLLLLHGKQSHGKTSFADFLLPKDLKSLFFEAKSVDVNNKDRIYENATKLIVELGEIHSTFKKSDVDSFKAYITSIYDLLRRPYDREHSKFKRRVVFIGTTNNYNFIQDVTGSRRFVSLINFSFDIEKAKKIDINKIWSYIYSCYLQNEKFWFTNKDLEIIQEENSNHMYKREDYIILEKYFKFKNCSSPGYKIKECWKYIESTLEFDEKLIINSYRKLSDCFKNYNADFKYDRGLKTNIWYVEFLKPKKEIISNKIIDITKI